MNEGKVRIQRPEWRQFHGELVHVAQVPITCRREVTHSLMKQWLYAPTVWVNGNRMEVLNKLQTAFGGNLSLHKTIGKWYYAVLGMGDVRDWDERSVKLWKQYSYTIMEEHESMTGKRRKTSTLDYTQRLERIQTLRDWWSPERFSTAWYTGREILQRQGSLSSARELALLLGHTSKAMVRWRMGQMEPSDLSLLRIDEVMTALIGENWMEEVARDESLQMDVEKARANSRHSSFMGTR